MDIGLGDGPDGITTAGMILCERELPIVFLTANSNADTIARIERTTAYGYVHKTGDETALVASVRMAFRLWETKRQLAEERWRLEAIIAGTNVGTWEWNVLTGETRFNRRWAQIVGYSLEELEPVSIRTWEGLVHPDDAPRSAEALRRHFAGESEFYECECRMRHRDGGWVWVLDKGRVFTRTAAGEPLLSSPATWTSPRAGTPRRRCG